MSRTLAIAMDAADSELVLEWMAAGELPVLASLAERGSVARLETGPGVGAEVVWPMIVSGCLPGKNGMYNWRSIVPGTDRLVRTPHATYVLPFWSQLRREPEPQRALLVDVPYAPVLEEDGITQVLGWGQRGTPRHRSWPEHLLEEVRSRHGVYPGHLDEEHHGRRRRADRIRRGLREMTEVRTRLVSELMRECDWELCLATYFEPHYAGHAFHRYLDSHTMGHDRGREALAGALLDVYRTFDDGVGELMDAAGEDVDVVVFSGFGMRPNTNGLAVLDQLMSGLGYHVPRAHSAGTRRTEAIRQLILRAIPGDVRRALNRRLPEGTSDRHLERLWAESTDWERTAAYALGEPGHSHVRIAHRRRGDAERLSAEIVAELERLVDADTGEPAVAEIVVSAEAFAGPHVEFLPDIWIHWADGGFHHRVRHPELGVLEEDLNDVKVSEHSHEGFVVAAGPGVRRSAEEARGHVVDLAPTILHLHGRAIPEELDGSLLDVLDPGLGPPLREPIEIYDGDPWRGL